MAPTSAKDKKKAAMAAHAAAKEAQEKGEPMPSPAAKPETPRTIRKRKANVPAPAALAVLRAVQQDFQALRLKHEAKVLRTAIRLDSDGVPTPSRNRALFAYEDALLKLLERLDGVQPENIGAIREARKNNIKNIQDRLAVLDRVKKGETVEVPADLLDPLPASASPAATRKVAKEAGRKNARTGAALVSASESSASALFGKIALGLVVVASAAVGFLYYRGMQTHQQQQ
ncbi:hypothetical protein HDU87_005395 [Geranomyces variabilis]|uniref:BAG domain-containing protein n=1 Tax=Geranomyces variabilis TaxID=109894 RepID=A0AAD5XR72_9FUNG|nr:hypothetical protein HDU87_005395 [Geranomyces variabilis]